MNVDFVNQIEVCKKWGAPFVETLPNCKIGIARNMQEGAYPINGLRHSPKGSASGWYIWAGDVFSESDDFFLPLHAKHIGELYPTVKVYLGLAPGWRFIIAPDYEDVWFDASLLAH